MVALPRHIASWAELMSCFPNDVAELVMSMVNQLSPMIDSCPSVEELGTIEPDGLAGVGRNSRYERLLLSEWALQEYLPEEFIRRAVSGEHLFYEMKNIDRRENRTCIALFDCGPEQLGKPRVVQLAILILLARRAEKNGSEFKWGVLQDEKRTVNIGLNQELVRAWLKQRSMFLSDQSMLDAWIEVFMRDIPNSASSGKKEYLALSEVLQDFWCICPSRLHFPSGKAREIEITEPLLNLKRISVDIKSGGTSRRVDLNLPKEHLNVKIIRNPFEETAKALISAHWQLSGSWLISANGRKIACRDQNDNISVHSINVSSQSRKNQPAVFHVPNDRHILGLHISKRRTVVLSSDREHFYFQNYPVNGQLKKIDKKQKIRADKEHTLLSTIVLKYDGGKESVLILDAQRHLRELVLNEDQSLFQTRSKSVLALGSLINCDYYIEYDSDKRELTLFWYLGATNPCSKKFKVQRGIPEPTVFVYGGGPWQKGSVGCFAYESDRNAWSLVTGNKSTSVEVEEGDKAIGVIAHSRKLNTDVNPSLRNSLSLVVLKPDLRTVSILSEEGEVRLPALSSALVSGNINPLHPYLHYLNQQGELVVMDLIKGDEILRLAESG